MNLPVKIILSTALLITTLSFSTSAQRRLPASHTSEHNALLANQKPMVNPFKIENNNLLLDQIKEREQADIATDAEIYSKFWASDRVNPYGTAVTIPEHKNIDVSEYVPPVKGVVTSGYGYRPRFRRMHYGVDLNLHTGDTVRAAFSGKVRLTKYEARGYGYYVVMRHDNGMETVYGHLSRFLVKPNQVVKAGDPIALGGSTGRSTGPHLHFETRYLGIAINPAAIIDFDNKVVHKDVFAFDKTTYTKSQKYAPSKRVAKKGRAYAKRKSSSRKRRR